MCCTHVCSMLDMPLSKFHCILTPELSCLCLMDIWWLRRMNQKQRERQWGLCFPCNRRLLIHFLASQTQIITHNYINYYSLNYWLKLLIKPISIGLWMTMRLWPTVKFPASIFLTSYTSSPWLHLYFYLCSDFLSGFILLNKADLFTNQ